MSNIKLSKIIDYKDLMIGNIICLNGFHFSIVKSIDDHGIELFDNENYYPHDKILGVIITDEILNILGFYCIETNKKSMMDVEYINKVWSYNGWFNIEKEDQDIHAECVKYNIKYSEEDSFDVFINGNYITCISFVHELQNLFKLTHKNIELDVKKLIK